MSQTWNSPAVSGLTEKQRAHARNIVAHGARLCLARAGDIHYTQSAKRWEGIDKHLLIKRGEYPRYADCSSMATWLLWNALFVPYGVKDIVNNENWHAGYTGTQIEGGKIVRYESSLKVGDLVLYNGHVAVYIGGGYVFSHGSEGGPYKLPVHYRTDVVAFRRFI